LILGDRLLRVDGYGTAAGTLGRGNDQRLISGVGEAKFITHFSRGFDGPEIIFFSIKFKLRFVVRRSRTFFSCANAEEKEVNTNTIARIFFIFSFGII
jgi:hypothetical protein